MTKPTDPTNEPLYEGKTFFQYIMDLSIDMTGEPDANPITAFAQWTREREAMAELYSENEGLKILNRRLLLTLTLAEKAVARSEKDAMMFITQAGRDTIQKFREQVKQIQNSIAYSKEINHG
jgi:hypothetical protein